MESPASAPANLPSRRCLALFAVVGSVGYACGVVGTLQMHHLEGGQAAWPSALYHALQLFLLDSEHYTTDVPWTLQVGRLLCGITGLAAMVAILSAALGSSLLGLLVRLRGRHVIVVGPGPISMAVARSARRAHQHVLLIGARSKAAELKLEAAGSFPTLTGSIDQESFLRRCGASSAARVLCVGRDDADNLAVAAALEHLPVPSTGQARKVLVTNPEARACLSAGPGFLAGIELVALDIDERRARRFFEQHPLDFLPLQVPASGEAPLRATLVVLGWSNFLAALVVQAGRIAHYPSAALTRVLLITPGPQPELDGFRRHWPALDEVLELSHVRFAPGDPGLRLLLLDEAERAERRHEPLTVVISGGLEVSDHLGAALWIQRLLPPGTDAARLVPDIEAAQELEDLVGSATFRADNPNVSAFVCPSLESTLSPDLEDSVDRLARGLHAEYLRSRGLARAGAADTSLRPAEKPWEHLDETFRISTRAQADHLPIKLRAIGCEVAPAAGSASGETELTRDEVELLARLEHQRWSAERRLAGWTLAPARDDRLQHHNHLVPWDELDESERYIDRDVVTGANRALRPLGLVVRRSQ